MTQIRIVIVAAWLLCGGAAAQTLNPPARTVAAQSRPLAQAEVAQFTAQRAHAESDAVAVDRCRDAVAVAVGSQRADAPGYGVWFTYDVLDIRAPDGVAGPQRIS